MQISNDGLISLSDAPTSLSSDIGIQRKKSYFQLKRVLVFILISIGDIIVNFHRACPTVVTDELAAAYHVQVSRLGIFSSMFYYPYSLFQPFSGLLSDIIEPAYLITISTIISSIGAVICGLSQSLLIGCIGRFIVGAGCSLMFCPCNTILINWFPLQHYSKILGLFIFIAGCGNLLAQTPLTLLAKLIGWRWCFFSISIFATINSLIIFIFVRGSPIVHGYPAVNESLTKTVNTLTFSEKFRKLLKNLQTVSSNPSLWFMGFFVFFGNGACYNVAGIWGGPYLKEVFGYDSVKASNALLGLSIGGCVGSLIDPYLSLFLCCKSKKLTSFLGTIVAILCCIPLGFYHEKLNYGFVIALFALFAMTTTGLAAVNYPLCIQNFHPSMGATVTGCLNCFAFVSLIVFMPVTGKILDHFGTKSNGSGFHNPDGFKYGLWLFNICDLILGGIMLLFVKSKKNKGDDSKNYETVE